MIVIIQRKLFNKNVNCIVNSDKMINTIIQLLLCRLLNGDITSMRIAA